MSGVKQVMVFTLIMLSAQRIASFLKERGRVDLKYYGRIAVADRYLYASRFDSALAVYRQTFNDYPQQIELREYVKAAASAYKLKDFARADQYASLAMEGQAVNADVYYEIRKEYIDSMMSEQVPGFKRLLEKYADTSLTLRKSYNAELAKVLEAVYDRDQDPRVAIHNLRKENKAGSQRTIDSLSIVTHDNDAVNKRVVIEILEKYGWPAIADVGAKASAAVFTTIQHLDADSVRQEKYLRLLSKRVRRGEIRSIYLGLLTDRIMLRKTSRQRFGSQVRFNEATNKYEPHPLENLDQVDALRASIAMQPLEVYLKLFE